MAENNAVAVSPVSRLKEVMATPSVKEQFQNALAENSNLFVASLIDLVGSDKALQACNPSLVIMEALKAATLRLPINKQLGFAYIIAYGNKPTFQIGYKGLVQLAMRTGAYTCINADVVYDGEFKGKNRLTAEIDLSGEKKSDEVVGYFAYIEMTNGFKKTMYMSKEEVAAHAKKYSKSFNNSSSAWKTDFDKMAMKTPLRLLLGKYGMMSIDMERAMGLDNDTFEADYRENANSTELPALPGADLSPTETIGEGGEIIDMAPGPVETVSAGEPNFAV